MTTTLDSKARLALSEGLEMRARELAECLRSARYFKLDTAFWIESLRDITRALASPGRGWK